MKSMKQLLSIAVILSLSSAAHAWGDREQGALLGAIIGGVLVNAHKNQPQTQPQAPQIIYNPAPVVIQQPNYTQASPSGPQLCGYNVLCPVFPAQPVQRCWIQTTINVHGVVIGQTQICQ